MKKIALAILSVFMIFGGVLLSACEKKVSLSISSEEIVIYTNDEQEENYKQKDIDVTVANSSAGANVEILKGQDTIRVSSVKHKTGDIYTFTIFGDKSGEAEVRVSAIEDNKQNKIINVKVNTILEELKTLPDDSVDSRTNLYVVKNVPKKLNVKDYFNLQPSTANVADIVWTFEDTGKQEYVKDDKLIAKIQDGMLYVYNEFAMTNVYLRASFVRNMNVYNTVKFEVLQNSTINNLTIDDKTLYQNNAVATRKATFELKRNDSVKSSVDGEIVINSLYNINLDAIVYSKNNDGTKTKLSRSEFEQYFTFEITRKTQNQAENKITYGFKIDAIDKSTINKFGSFYFYLQIGYQNYNFDITTESVDVIIDTSYSATSVEISNENKDILNNSIIDVFSNYTTGNGFKLRTLVLPDDVAIDNSMFFISVDLNQENLRNLNLPVESPVSTFVKFFYKGELLTFTPSATGSSIYVSTFISNASDIYIASAENFDVLEGIDFKFVSVSNANANAELTVNFYKVSTDKNLIVTDVEGNVLDDKYYLASNSTAPRAMTFTVKIEGISTISGLSLKMKENTKFKLSGIELKETNAGGVDGGYVVVEFSISLTSYNFADSTYFWFEHVTGKKSSNFVVDAFVPLQSATIQNGDRSSSDVYKEETSSQNFMENAGAIEVSNKIIDNSLSKLMLEAGIRLPLNTNYQNASLGEKAISYKFLSYDALKAAIRIVEGLNDADEIEQRVKEIFGGSSLNLIAGSYFRYFENNNGTLFTITQDSLSLTDNEFKGYVCILFSGYDENHELISVARFFALESFYSVKHLSSNVQTTLLYTTETLSLNDIAKSRVDVSISLRPDEKVPTYTDDISYFTFASAIDVLRGDGVVFENKYYSISDISYSQTKRQFNFRITANSTNMQTSIRDILKISYLDSNGFKRETEIQIEIRNVKRIENVQWLNQTADNEIYLNLSTTVSSEKSFTISTSVSPSDANDIGLSYSYFATAGSGADLIITTSTIGQNFYLNLNTSKGGYGSLFLLPNDMIKIVDGVKQILVYKYSQDADGKLIETPVYRKLSELNIIYNELINGSNEVSNYFYNNNNEKIYYKDIIIKIAITIADGGSEGTAIRVYNEEDMKKIDYAKYYKIMNNITLNNWVSYNQFNGMFFGKDENITLRFENGSQNFVDELNGTIKNLVFTGKATSQGIENAGFIANINNGTIENVSIDVYYLSGKYLSSTLNSSATSSVGGIVGLNNGTIKNTFTYGATINALNANNTGGLVGNNKGNITGCGVEFYLFANADGSGNSSNTINAGNVVGGIVGLADSKSKIDKSYVYAYSLVGTTYDDYKVENIIKGGITLGVFMGKHSEGASVTESFGYMGSLKNPANSPTNSTLTHFKNSYLTYKDGTKTYLRAFRDVQFSYDNGYVSGTFANYDLINTDDIPTISSDPSTGSVKWNNLVAVLNKEIWETENIDKNSNFGFMYLKNVSQSADVDISNVKIANNTNPLKSLNADTGAGNIEKGILFVYNTLENVNNPSEIAALNSLNTISISDLFGITSKQARSLLITSESRDISISTNSIRVLSKNVDSFELSVHLKMNFTKSKTFNFVIINYLPELKTTIDSIVLKDGQTVLLQTGLNNSRTVMFNLSNTIYLNGNAYTAEKDNYSIEYNVTNNVVHGTSNNNLSISKTNNSLKMLGITKHEDGNVTNVESFVVVDDIAQDANFKKAIKNQRTRNFDVSVFNGATSLVVNNATNLVVKPSQFAVFAVLMTTDNSEDGLIFGLKYGEVEIKNNSTEENSASFDVDDNLSLDLSWTKQKSDDGLKDIYRVIVKIKDSKKHLIVKDYENLVFSINAKSQLSNSNFVKTVGLKVQTQNIEDINLVTYNIKSRQIKNSVLYLTPSNEITNTLVPSTDAMLAVMIDPTYAKMTHFTLTYSTSSSGNVGTVSLSRLSYNSNYNGYYANSNSTSLITNGIRVNLTSADKTGEGIFYFRLYVSSTFDTNSGLQLTLTCFYENDVLISGTQNLKVSYMPEATVKVNGVSTYVLSKGSTATVTVTVASDQNLYDLYLQNNKENISLSAYTVEEFASYKVYTALITAYVDAKLDDNKGVFYVCASVERIVNNVQEIKVNRATLCLVDFSVDGNNISVKSSGGTTNYNGKTYDVFYSYVNSTDTLNFNYPIVPESYNYDKNNASEVEAVNKIMEKREKFAQTNNYKDDDAKYYINYIYNENLGIYESLALKQQLWYATDENISSAIYNGKDIIQKDTFRIDESENSGVKLLTITGKRTGRQLMKLQTTVVYQGIEFVYDYYFLIVVDIWSDENTPTQIDSAEKFIDFTTKSEKADDYILMSDIVLNNYSPVNTDLIKSMDGNGFTIHINSFAFPEGNTLNLALFNNVKADTTLKNIRVNIYNGGQISVDVNKYKTVNIAGFALENNGVIYNCEVISSYDSKYQDSTLPNDNGLIVKYTMGNNSDPINLTTSMNIESIVSGFVGTNNASIMNSRVGGASFQHIVDIAGVNYVKTDKLGTFVLEGQGQVSGFVNSNSSTGNLSASFADNIQIYNNMASTTSLTAGFALFNYNNIQNSYVEGVGEETNDIVARNDLTNITSLGIVAGFVYSNEGLVKNSYSNIAIENSKSKASMVAGFVYRNETGAEVTLCYTACWITKTDINQMQFSGVDDFSNSLNFGNISFSYFYNDSRIDDTAQTKVTNGALSVNNIADEDTFYGFSFSSAEDSYDGIWKLTKNGISLVSANKIAFSNRYAKTTGNITNIFYNKNILDADTFKTVDLSYGGENNPIIIRNAYDFAVSTGKATAKEISAYKEYYNDKEVFGNYRIVNNIDMSEIDQNSENENSVKLTTTTKTFKGLLDGNGFTISNINLGSSVACENFGLFAKLYNAVVMNLDFIVDSIHNSQANIVGALAGTAVNTRILAINLAPTQSQGTSNNTSILGSNIVGGVVGMLFGESRLNDIHIKDIDIYSSYYKAGKSITSNRNYVGANMREYVGLGNSLQTKVRELSYAGAIAGYVDIYDDVLSDYVKFYSNLNASDFDIVTVHVSDAVNIYGEVSGGLFGYVGNSTLIYDASIELNADMSLSHPSYIISKNLYAGGLIGENYGGLFAVYASYESDLQDTIEKSENAYYGGSSTAERGQKTIFSYLPEDQGYISNIDDPLFIGGLVGYMGGGYVYIGYNKLNVISHSSNTLAVGGIIGMAGYMPTQYDLSAINGSPKVNIFLNEVYASGDVSIDKTGNTQTDSIKVSAGIIGALEKNKETTIVAMKYASAVNYYSYAGDKLAGVDHYMIVGKIFNTDKDSIEKEEILKTDMFLVNSDNNYFNVKDAKDIGSSGARTVGGYNFVKIGAAANVGAKLSPYGFKVSWLGDNQEDIYNNILKIESIGESSMNSMSAAYAKMYNYFLANGWSDEFWNHTEERLFPHIELLPKLNVQFWDVYNTSQVLSLMNNSSITVVVRGKVDKDTAEYQDIDLTSDKNKGWKSISGFKGKLISYFDYVNSDSEGLISDNKEIIKNGLCIGGYSKVSSKNQVADRVGIIINKSLFTNMSDAVDIEGLNFYFYEDNSNASFGIVDGSVTKSVFRNLNIVINNNKTLVTESENIGKGDDIFSTGLISNTAFSTSFINIDFTFRNNSELNLVHNNSAKDNAKVYFGLLSGYVENNSSFISVSIDKINIKNESLDENSKVNVNFRIDKNKVSKVYAGLYAGTMIKSGSAKMGLGLSILSKVNLNIFDISDGTVNNNTYYVGGYVGEVYSVDKVELAKTEAKGDSEGISIFQHCNLGVFYAGLGFGSIANSNLQISNNGTVQSKITGGIYQVEDVTSNEVNIGGIAGRVSSGAEIQGFNIDLTIAKANKINGKSEKPDYTTGKNRTLFDESLYDYKEGTKATGNDQIIKLSPYATLGSVEDSFGGFFGYVSGTKVRIIGNCTISGTIDVAISAISTKSDTNRFVSVGGMVGKTTGTIETNAIGNNTINISVSEIGDSPVGITNIAYVGGVIGNVVKIEDNETSSSNYYIKINDNASTNSKMIYTGNILSSIDSLSFGGAIGYVGRGAGDFENEDKAVIISNYSYGGAVRIYGKNIAGGKVDVGGIVGTYSIENISPSLFPSTTHYSISNCFTFGDVFVNYTPFRDGIYVNDKLERYNFGGIVGSASCIKIKECSSIMTSFNNRMSSDGSESVGNYNVNAIVGDAPEKSDGTKVVKFEDNKYSSGVCMAYQEEDGNKDVSYSRTAKSSIYSGYTSVVARNGETDDTKLKEKIENDKNILDDAKEFFSVLSDLQEGTKLNPYKWEDKDRNKHIKSGDSDTNDSVAIDGNTHNIKWIALTENLNGESSLQNSIAENFSNIVFVGNGHIIGRDDTFNNDLNKKDGAEPAKNLGGIVNTMGKEYNENYENLNSNTPVFSVISGLVVNLNVTTADINASDSSAKSYGGVAGIVYGNSFIYGVGIKGELSVGGLNQKLQLGGIVGTMVEGRIEECYVDANITYRAAEGGKVSGIANLTDHNTTIKATYSSGMIETYLDINVYTFANSTMSKIDNSILTSNDMADCYSVSQIKRNNALGTASTTTGGNYFISGFNKLDESGKINVIKNVIHGCYDVPQLGSTNSENTQITDFKDIATLSLIYSSSVRRGWKSIIAPKETGSETSVGYSTWYFSPLINYGYASHGFGYLKNVTTVTREKITETNGYSYSPVSYKDIVIREDKFNSEISSTETTPWFLFVPNAGKFEQMISTVKTESSDYNKDFKFVLKYSFDMLTFPTTGSGSVLGQNIGKADKHLEIDGNNNSLDFGFTSANALASGLFGKVVGNISNLKINDINIKNNVSTKLGGLASEMTGELNNVSVVGNIKNEKSGAYVGGTVGLLNGNANFINSVVNIENSGSNSIIGGVAGYLERQENKGIITYSSNSGMITNTSTSDNGVVTSGGNGASETIKPKVYNPYKNSNYEIPKVNNILGGIVGYADGGSVEHSYNANSLINGYSVSNGGSYITGGIVGYSNTSKINECFNTGLVGSGNTSNTNYVFSGGIFGFGNGSIVTNCINDASVEAIGTKPNSSNYSITKTLKSGVETNTGYTKKPDDLVYDVEIVYNSNNERHIYSYGIGYIGFSTSYPIDSGISKCSSSINNIKNYGNLGQIVWTGQLTFDRSKILDNDEGSLNFFGEFDIEDQLYINGLDAFDFPARVYMNDMITRTYGNPTGENATNDIKTAEKVVLPVTNHRRKYNGKYVYQGEGDNAKYVNTSDNVYDGDTNSTDFGDSEYTLGATSTYYSSLEFPGYETILNDVNGQFYGLIGYDCNNEKDKKVIKNETATTKNEDKIEEIKSVEDGIVTIEKANEYTTPLRNITINGESASIIYTADNFKTVYAPCDYEVRAVFDISSNKIDINSLSNRNFGVSSVSITNDDGISISINPQYYTVSYKVEGNQVIVDYKLFFAQKVDGKLISAQMTYTTTPFVTTLGVNNVVREDNKTYIIPKDGTGQNIISKELVDLVNNEPKTKLSVKLGGIDITANCELIFGNIVGMTNIAYLKYNGSFTIDYFDGKSLSVEITKTDTGYTFGEGTLSTTSANTEFTIGKKSVSSIPYRFKGYAEASMNSVYGDLNFEDITVDNADGTQTYVIGKKLNLGDLLSKIEESEMFSDGKHITKISFGNTNYSIYYNNGNWIVDKDTANDAIKFKIIEEGGIKFLVIKAAPLQNGIETDLDESNVNRDYNYELKDDFLDGTFSKFKIVYKKVENIKTNNSISKTQSVSTIKTPFELIEEYAIQTAGNFDTDGKYTGTDIESEIGKSGINAYDQTFYGLKFYELEVYYSYALSQGKITINDTLGYELLCKDKSGTIRYLKQGASDGSDATKTITLKDIQANETISITSYKTNTIGFASDSVFRLGDDNTLKLSPVESVSGVYECNYSISKGIEIDPYTKESSAFTRTLCSFTQAASLPQTLYAYEYTIYENGTITISYTYNNTNGKINSDKMMNSILYMYNSTKDMSNVKEVKYKRLQNDNYKDPDYNPDGYYFEWDYSNINSKPFDKSYFEGRDSVGGIGGEKSIEVMMVAGSVVNDKILNFVKNLRNQTFKVNIKSPKETTINISYSYAMYSKQNSSVTIDKPGLEYRTVGANGIKGNWTNAQNGKTISTDKIGKYTFEYRYKNTISKNVTIPSNEKDVGESAAKYMIFERDIHIGMDTIVENNISIIGNGHYLRFISNNTSRISLFVFNNSNIQNLNVIGIISMQNITSNDNATFLEKIDENIDNDLDKYRNQYAMLFVVNGQQDEIIPKISNVSVFGNIRNVIANAGNVVVKPTIYQNIGKVEGNIKEIISVDSHITVTGLKSSEGEDVNSFISDTIDIVDMSISGATQYYGIYSLDSYLSKNILISGDGANGTHGANGNTTENTSMAGEDASNGRKGGNISVQKETFDGIVKLGSSGAGSYGGNGAHGYFDGNNSLGGGKGGKSSTKGDDATITEVVESGKTVAKKYIQIGTIGYSTNDKYKGNGGIGGFGRIQEKDGNIVYYTSGGGGGLEGNGGNGTTGANWITSPGDNCTYFGFTRSLHMADSAAHLYPTEKWFWGFKQDDWMRNIKNEMSGSGNKQTESTGIAGAGGGGQATTSKMYVNIQIDTHRGFLWFGLFVDKYSKVLWSSGESINQAGSYAYSSNAKVPKR